MPKSTPKVSSFLCERGFMEENFIELLEAYLDEEEIKSKKNSDISMGGGIMSYMEETLHRFQ